jgi:DNA-binding winged helix-turn-helix (wHTH) protein/tetratricopeptide (TPR) repeat protein
MRSDPRTSAAAEPQAPSLVRFGPFAFDLGTCELTHSGSRLHLQHQPARVLAELLRAGGRIVSRETLREALWGDRFVDYEQGLNFCIRQVRAALGDVADTPVYIETLPKRGYRFIVPIEQPAPRPTRSRTRVSIAIAVAACTIAAAIPVLRSHSGATLDVPRGPDDEQASATLSPSNRVRFLMATSILRDAHEPQYARAAILLDTVLMDSPGFVPARIARAEAWLWGGRTNDARSALDAILRVAPTEGRAYTLRGALALFRDWDLPAAGPYLKKGRDLTPQSSVANHFLAYYNLLTGDTQAARVSIDRALQLDPLSGAMNGDAGMVRYWLRDFNNARALCARGTQLDPSLRSPVACAFLVASAVHDTPGVMTTATALARMDRAPAAITASLAQGSGLQAYLAWDVGRLAQKADSGPGTALDVARRYILRGDRSGALAALRSGLARHSNALLFALVDPILDPVKADPVINSIRGAIPGLH